MGQISYGPAMSPNLQNPSLFVGCNRMSLFSLLARSPSFLILGFTKISSPKMSRQPEVLWAQRSDKIYLTISLPDAKDVSVKTEPEGVFNFSAAGAHGEAFTFSLQLYGAILPASSKVNIGLRNIFCSLQKEKRGWWMRLLKSEEKPAPYIKVDWNRWCDEDEAESMKSDSLASDDDDDNGEEESDDDGLLYLPDLEKARKSL